MTSSSKLFILIILVVSMGFANEVSPPVLVEGNICEITTCYDEFENPLEFKCTIEDELCVCPTCPETEVVVDNCGEVAPENIRECCDKWVTDNNLPMPPCKGEWEISEDSCSWVCVEEAIPSACGRTCPNGKNLKCKVTPTGECICEEECPIDNTFVCEDYTCPSGKIAQCEGDENSCSCETCEEWADLWSNAKVECQDGYTELMGGPTSCKSSGIWHKYADEICQGRSEVNTFEVQNFCGTKENMRGEGATKKKIEEVTIVAETEARSVSKEYACPAGMCMLKEKASCVSQGTIAEVTGQIMFCDIDETWQITGEEGADCLNNYECNSNFCSNRKCMDIQKELAEQRSLLDQILEFFAKLFGMA